MSRSLVGSSRSSTLGSERSSLSSWKRRRSPPERSPRRAVSLSPVKPKRSSIELAETSLPVLSRVTRRMSSMLGSTRASGSSTGTCWVRCSSAIVRPRLTRPASGSRSPETRESTELLPGAVDPDDADPVARAEPPGRVVQQLLRAAGEVDVLEVDDVLAQALGGEALQREPVPRLGDVVDQRVGRVDAELRLRGARRRAAAQPGELLAHQVLPALLGGRGLTRPLGLGEHEGGVPALVGVDDPGAVRARGAPPRSARRRRRGTTGRG